MTGREKGHFWLSTQKEQALIDALAAELGPSWDPRLSGSLHGYFAPARGAAGRSVLSSCTGSPLGDDARALCLDTVAWITGGPDRAAIRKRAARVRDTVVESLLQLVGAPAGTEVVLAASPADSFRLMGMLYAIEAEGQPLRVLVPTVAEIASAVPMGLEARHVLSGPRFGEEAPDGPIEVIQIPMRRHGGEVIDDGELALKFRDHAARVDRRALVYSSLGDATGLIGPRASGALGIDASQMRLRPDRIGAHLALGLPVVIAGSTFLGGPAESGALLVPSDRFKAAALREARRRWREDAKADWEVGEGPNRGLRHVLRWLPAVENLRRLAALGTRADTLIAYVTMELTTFLGRFADFHVFPGRDVHQVATCGREAGMVTFAVRDLKRPNRWLPMPELVTLYHRIADAGALIGHPVGVGSRGGLRLAISAEDVLRGDIAESLDRLETVFHGIGYRTTPMRRQKMPSPKPYPRGASDLGPPN
ncbi:hypothetical protein [Acidisoma sp. 7E03]